MMFILAFRVCGTYFVGMLFCISGKETDDMISFTAMSICPKTTHFIEIVNETIVCRRCSKCDAGHGVKKKCTHKTDTVCKKCPSGYFSSEGSNQCRKCKSCEPPFHTVRTCSKQKNTKCGICKHHRFYSTGKQKCVKCKACPPGYYVNVTCSYHSDTVCAECPTGTYSESYNMDAQCTPCRPCDVNSDVVRNCTTTKNSICGYCKAGYFRKRTGSCAQCSPCYKEFPGYTHEVDECKNGRNTTANVCAPTPYSEILYNLTRGTKSNEDKELMSAFIKFVIGGSGLIVIVVLMAILIMCFTHYRNMKIATNLKTRMKITNKNYFMDDWIQKSTYNFASTGIISSSAPYLYPTEEPFTKGHSLEKCSSEYEYPNYYKSRFDSKSNHIYYSYDSVNPFKRTCS